MVIPMKVVFYTSASGRSPVEEFIDTLTFEEQSKIFAALENISLYGREASGIELRQLKGKMWEIKIRTISGGFRFLYIMAELDVVFILHAFKKISQKTPLRHLDIAEKRMKGLR